MKFLTEKIRCDDLCLKVFRSEIEPSLPTVLFINAIGMEAALATRLGFEFRSAGYNFVTWELRGSPGPALSVRDCKLENHVRDGLEILANLGVSRINLVGWCTGASIALFLVEKLGSRVTTLILADGAYLFDNVPGGRLGNAMYSMCSEIVTDVDTAPRYHELTYPKGNEAPVLGLHREPELLRHMIMPYGKDVDALVRYAFAIHSACDYDPASVCSRVKCPTLLTAGTGDLMVSYRNSEKAARLIKGSEFKLFENGSHYSIFTDVEVLRHIIVFANMRNFAL